MQRAALLLVTAMAASLVGCQSRQERIERAPELYRSLDAATQEKIRRGEIEVGYTMEMVRLALGEPTDRATGPDGGSVWIYRQFHRDRNDIIHGGYRRRIVFDPVRRSETVIIEPIDDRLAAKLAPSSLHITWRDGRVATIERVPEI